MTRLARLKWHCRRGMRELDVLLEGFLENRFQSLSADDSAGFERLLDCENEELWAWLLEGETPRDEQLASVVSQILDSRDAGSVGTTGSEDR